MVRLSVVDDGPGIPSDLQAQLFEPFGAAALRKAGVQVDTGLGLPSCRVMARAIKAELAVHSDGKHGATFSLVLSRRSPVK
jgi:signal transduction histidine kinase